MRYEVNFGQLASASPPKPNQAGNVFRLAVLGDFSARANRGEVAVGDKLAARKPLRVDVDNLDDVMQRLGIRLQLDLGGAEGAVEVEIGSMDSFHPDELYENLEIFSHLAGLRQRLLNRSTYEKAAAEMQSWHGTAQADTTLAGRPKPRGAVVATDCKLSDFARLTQRSVQEQQSEVSLDVLLKYVVAPHVVPAKDAKQDVLVAAVDAAVADLMRRVLHHPDFQATEALWRSVDLLVRRLETGSTLKIVLYDVTAEEFAADLSAAGSLEESGLHKLLVEQPALDAQQGAVSVIVGNYLFEQTPPHAELLGRMAKIAAAAQAPFIASIGTDCLKKVDPEDVPPLIASSWDALRSLPEAVYLALTVPRFMIRNPYGERTDPIDRFDFEEFTPQYGLRGMLWGYSSALAGLVLGLNFSQQGFKKMDLGSVLTVDDLPFYFYTDSDNDQVALPCTERLLTAATAAHVSQQGFIPVLSMKGRPEIRVGGLQSLSRAQLAGPWAPVVIAASAPSVLATKAAVPPADSVSPSAPAAAASNSPTHEPAVPAAAPVAAAAPPVAVEATEDDLDAILAGLGEPEPTSGEPPAIDPDLAALLGDL